MSKFIIRLTPDGTLTVPEWQEDNEYIRSLIGEKCDIYEHVKPNRLYTAFKCLDHPDSRFPGRHISMLMDEEANFHNLPINPVASWLYEFDKHGCVIRGTVLFVGEMWQREGIRFCAVDDMAGLALLANLSTAVSRLKKLDKEGLFFPKEGGNV